MKKHFETEVIRTQKERTQYNEHSSPLFLTSSFIFDDAEQTRHGGNIVIFQLDGGLEAGQAFLNKIEMCSLTANIGDSRTIVSHPATTTHSKLSPEDRLEVGITDGLVRLSIGLVNIKDIITDVDQALDKI